MSSIGYFWTGGNLFKEIVRYESKIAVDRYMLVIFWPQAYDTWKKFEAYPTIRMQQFTNYI